MPINEFTPEIDFAGFGTIQKDFVRVWHPMVLFTFIVIVYLATCPKRFTHYARLWKSIILNPLRVWERL